MVTDCLAPVIAEKGVATIVTCDSMKLLCEGLVFRTVRVQSYDWDGKIYGLRLKLAGTKKPKLHSTKMYVDADCHLKTPDGWLPAKEFPIYMRTSRGQRRLVRAYYFKCLICGTPYLPTRPMQGVCSRRCMGLAKRDWVMVLRPVNAETVHSIMIEDWVEVATLDPTDLPGAVQAVRFTDIDGDNGAYCNGLLMSCKTLQSKVESKE
jgi:hypothetical protein